jgi:hypothetical protein
MPCDTMLKPKQTIAQRMREIRDAARQVDKLLAARRVQLKIGPQGAVAFTGIPDDVRDGMTDACIYRSIMRTGSAGAKMALARAEQLAGRSIDRKQVAGGTHSHDGGTTWHARG